MNIYRILLPETVYQPQPFHIEISPDDSETQVVEIHFPTDIKTDLPIDYSYHENRYGFRLSNSEIRDYLAHRQVWEDFLQTGEPGCWVIESNVQLQISAKELQETTEELSEEKELDLFFPYEGGHGMNGLDLLNSNYAEHHKHEPYLLGYKWGNSIYYLTRKGTTKLLQMDTIQDRLDNVLLDKSLQGDLVTYFAIVGGCRKNKISIKQNGLNGYKTWHSSYYLTVLGQKNENVKSVCYCEPSVN